MDGHTDGRLDGMKVWTDGGYMGWGVDGCLSSCVFGEITESTNGYLHGIVGGYSCG